MSSLRSRPASTVAVSFVSTRAASHPRAKISLRNKEFFVTAHVRLAAALVGEGPGPGFHSHAPRGGNSSGISALHCSCQSRRLRSKLGKFTQDQPFNSMCPGPGRVRGRAGNWQWPPHVAGSPRNIWWVAGPVNAELVQSGAQRAGVQAQRLGRPVLAFDDPASRFEHAEDVVTLDGFEAFRSGCGMLRFGVRSAGRRKRSIGLEHGPRARIAARSITFSQLAHVARPVGTRPAAREAHRRDAVDGACRACARDARDEVVDEPAGCPRAARAAAAAAIGTTFSR